MRTLTGSLFLEPPHTSVFPSINWEGPVARWQTCFPSDVTASRQRGLRGSAGGKTHTSAKARDKRPRPRLEASHSQLTQSCVISFTNKSSKEGKQRMGPKEPEVRVKHTLALMCQRLVWPHLGRPHPVLPRPGFLSWSCCLPGHNPGWIRALDGRMRTPLRQKVGENPTASGFPVIWQVNNSVQEELSTQSTLLSGKKSNSIIG